MHEQHEKINYLELPASNLKAVKDFFETVFQWQFTDYGPEYTAFSNSAGIDGGFYQANCHSSTQNGAALVVFYSGNLAATQAKIAAAGGKIVKPIFSFPGGQRFHFTDPCSNEYAVWSDQGVD
jgi:predicted enzyme related to lactoylglutathione lyase